MNRRECFVQFFEARGFRDVGCGTEVVCLRNVFFPVRRTEDDDRNVPELTVCFDGLQNFFAADARNVEIQQHKVRPGVGNRIGELPTIVQIVESLLSIADDVHLSRHVVLPENVLREAEVFEIIFYQ